MRTWSSTPGLGAPRASCAAGEEGEEGEEGLEGVVRREEDGGEAGRTLMGGE